MIEFLLAVTIGALYGSGVYLLLRRNLLKFILALGLISNGTHLLIFTSAGLTRGHPPLIDPGADSLGAPFADPLPQALILTAIVISFGLTAFTVLLIHRTHRATGSDDPDDLTTTDRLDPYRAPALPPLEIPRPPKARRSTKRLETDPGHEPDHGPAPENETDRESRP